MTGAATWGCWASSVDMVQRRGQRCSGRPQAGLRKGAGRCQALVQEDRVKPCYGPGPWAGQAPGGFLLEPLYGAQARCREALGRCVLHKYMEGQRDGDDHELPQLSSCSRAQHTLTPQQGVRPSPAPWVGAGWSSLHHHESAQPSLCAGGLESPEEMWDPSFTVNPR